MQRAPVIMIRYAAKPLQSAELTITVRVCST